MLFKKCLRTWVHVLRASGLFPVAEGGREWVTEIRNLFNTLSFCPLGLFKKCLRQRNMFCEPRVSTDSRGRGRGKQRKCMRYWACRNLFNTLWFWPWRLFTKYLRHDLRIRIQDLRAASFFSVVHQGRQREWDRLLSLGTCLILYYCVPRTGYS